MFPQRIPTLEEPEPPIHTLQTLRLPELLLNHYQVAEHHYAQHLWQVYLHLIQRPDHRLQMLGTVWHQGQQVLTRRSRPFSA